ncbi:hypothetical protein G3A56_16030 [Rhizobium oryzihabitans]|uniref:Uncharacterized protein n=1 Tax=Rhizobium oryzihabitans TaxID=2267833 RepID=A0A7L5BKB7_9HYPH|nr:MULTISPECIES: hypothetical protein [Rhizobium/Agrobacterium group]MDH2092756.1 hypothetical protein [Agrobacterium pusense]QIB39324.1 hypothetical protein G3A56_16030 [Rhizobium oryzihabitans]
MTSARIEAATQSRRASFRQPILCRHCYEPMSIAEQIECFCDKCHNKPTAEVQKGN